MTCQASDCKSTRKMASSWVLACVILSLFNIVCGNVPVLLWESSKSDKVNLNPALHRISSDDFQQYMKKKVHGEHPAPLVVIFKETSLSIEDFSTQDSEGKGNYQQLQYITENSPNVEFLPSVQNPIEAAKQLLTLGSYSLQEMDADENVDLPHGCGTVLIMKLQEANNDEDRLNFLSRHDTIIAEKYSVLLSKCSHVIGLLSAEQSSWMEPEEVSRMKRGAEDAVNGSTSAPGQYVVYQDKMGLSLLYSNKNPVLTYNGKEVHLGNFTTSLSGDNSKPQDIKLFVRYPASDYKITFNFDNKTSGYWYLRSVDLEVSGTPPATVILKSFPEIYAPSDMSYHSGTPVYFRNGSTTLMFSDLQVQPFFTNPGSKAFNDAVDSVEFFTPAIWSGIFVTFLLALIFTWGMSMIMDIRTMDQFDDPKGKTITVSATD